MRRYRTPLVVAGDLLVQFLRFRGPTRPLELQIARMERWSPQAIRDWQVERLREILSHCARRVPYYRVLFRRVGFSPETVKAPSDLRVLPPLTKDVIRRHTQELFAEGVLLSDLKKGWSGGSTGEPTPYFLSRLEAAWIDATFRRCFAWVGAKWGDRLLKIGPAPTGASQSLRSRLINWFNEGIKNIHSLPVPSLDDSSIDECLRMIEKIRPSILYGYPAAFEMVGRRMLVRKIRLPFVKVVWTSSETLYPHQRDIIREAFGLEVFDGYGTGDAPIALECFAHDGLHLFQHTKLIEVVDGDGKQVKPGQMGRVLVTQFYNFAWPCVRYDTGDIAELAAEGADCPCGVGLPKIKRVWGRIGDTLVTPDGKVIPAKAIPYYRVFGVVGSKIRCYQIYQEKKEEVLIRIVRVEGYDQVAEDHIRREISAILGESVRVRFQYVDDIPLTRSLKRRLVVSALPESELPFYVPRAYREAVES